MVGVPQTAIPDSLWGVSASSAGNIWAAGMQDSYSRPQQDSFLVPCPFNLHYGCRSA